MMELEVQEVRKRDKSSMSPRILAREIWGCKNKSFFFFIPPRHAACGILVP